MHDNTLVLQHEINATDATSLQWVQLLPDGKAIIGRDGRAWQNPEPTQILAAFAANGADLPIDIEHASELKAKQGEPAPAVGWIKALEIRGNSSVWGLVEWNQQGQTYLKDKAYRYLSPVFTYDKTNCKILKLYSAGLTNQPNLNLTALNQQQGDFMPLAVTLCRVLDLPENTTEALLIDKVTQLQCALPKGTNSLDAFVPRKDYDLIFNRAQQAENSLATMQAEQQQTEINTLLQQALQQGIITPATQDYHRSCCQQEGGLARFKAFMQHAPKVVGNIAFNHTLSAALSEEEQLTCRLLALNTDLFSQAKETA